MIVYFEELSAPKRAGGIDAACTLLTNKLRERGVDVIRSSTAPANYHSLRPDCVHIHGLWSPRLALQIIRWKRQGVPVVVSPHGMLDPWALAHKPIRKKIAWLTYQKRLLDQASALHATSEREASQFQGLHLKTKSTIVPWGVDVSSVSAASEPRDNSHQASRTALFLGRLYPVKGLPMLLEAWTRVRPAGWQLQIVGPDEAGHRAVLEKLVTDWSLQDCVAFSGPLSGSEKEQAYSGAELFVMPSYTENFGLAIGEALASGLPVLTTTGTPWDQLPKAGCGWSVEPTVASLSSVLTEATQKSADDLHQMGQRGRELVVSNFDWNSVTDRFLALYESCLSKSHSNVGKT